MIGVLVGVNIDTGVYDTKRMVDLQAQLDFEEPVISREICHKAKNPT